MFVFFKNICKTYITDDEAATAIEYGLIVAAIAVAISAVIFNFGDIMADNFSDSADLVAGRNAE